MSPKATDSHPEIFSQTTSNSQRYLPYNAKTNAESKLSGVFDESLGEFAVDGENIELMS
jgi:hypothetical protein